MAPARAAIDEEAKPEATRAEEIAQTPGKEEGKHPNSYHVQQWILLKKWQLDSPKFTCFRKRDGGKNLKVERRDGSKAIKKGDGNPRKISLGQLRREQKGDGEGRGGRGGKANRGGKGGRGGKRFSKGDRKDGKREPRDPKAREEELNKEMENYWIKGGETDQGKYTHRNLWDDLNSAYVLAK